MWGLGMTGKLELNHFCLNPGEYILSRVRATCNSSSVFITRRMLQFLLILDQGVRFGWKKNVLKFMLHQSTSNNYTNERLSGMQGSAEA